MLGENSEHPLGIEASSQESKTLSLTRGTWKCLTVAKKELGCFLTKGMNSDEHT